MTIRLEKILLPADFSGAASVAIRYGRELAVRFGAEVHLLHVLEPHISLIPNFGMGFDLPQYRSGSRSLAEQSLSALLHGETGAGLQIIRAVVEGSPKVEIVRYARKQEIDLIVLSTHGLTGLAHVLMGSVAENVVRTASCPVLTVRSEGHQFVMP